MESCLVCCKEKIEEFSVDHSFETAGYLVMAINQYPFMETGKILEEAKEELWKEIGWELLPGIMKWLQDPILENIAERLMDKILVNSSPKELLLVFIPCFRNATKCSRDLYFLSLLKKMIQDASVKVRNKSLNEILPMLLSWSNMICEDDLNQDENPEQAQKIMEGKLHLLAEFSSNVVKICNLERLPISENLDRDHAGIMQFLLELLPLLNMPDTLVIVDNLKSIIEIDSVIKFLQKNLQNFSNNSDSLKSPFNLFGLCIFLMFYPIPTVTFEWLNSLILPVTFSIAQDPFRTALFITKIIDSLEKATLVQRDVENILLLIRHISLSLHYSPAIRTLYIPMLPRLVKLIDISLRLEALISIFPVVYDKMKVWVMGQIKSVVFELVQKAESTQVSSDKYIHLDFDADLLFECFKLGLRLADHESIDVVGTSCNLIFCLMLKDFVWKSIFDKSKLTVLTELMNQALKEIKVINPDSIPEIEFKVETTTELIKKTVSLLDKKLSEHM